MWKVYTDGSAKPNPGPGGAGSVILRNGKVIAELVHTGGQTTNNKMELQAVIMTFPHLSKDEQVSLYTDSEYVQKGLTEWLPGWIKRGWKKANKKPVLNKELWQQLVALQKEYPQVKFVWIKAHQDKLPMSERVEGWEWNVRADELAAVGTARSKMSE